MNHELYLASKKIWNKNRKAIKEQELPLCAQGSERSAWSMAFSIMGCIGLLLISGCHQPAQAQETTVDCTDHALTPQLKQACVELVDICAEVGCTVSTGGKT